MNMKDYQDTAQTFCAYDDEMYPFLGLAEEVGEFLSYPAKMLRGDYKDKRAEDLDVLKAACEKEAGDILWMLQACLAEFDMDLDTIARKNIEKLTGRAVRNILSEGMVMTDED